MRAQDRLLPVDRARGDRPKDQGGCGLALQHAGGIAVRVAQDPAAWAESGVSRPTPAAFSARALATDTRPREPARDCPAPPRRAPPGRYRHALGQQHVADVTVGDRDPFAGGLRRRRVADHLQDLGERAGEQGPDIGEGELTHLARVDVGVGEAGDHRAPRQVDPAGVLAGQRLDLARRSDTDDPVAPHRHRLGDGRARVERDDPAVGQDQVGRLRHLSIPALAAPAPKRLCPNFFAHDSTLAPPAPPSGARIFGRGPAI